MNFLNKLKSDGVIATILVVGFLILFVPLIKFLLSSIGIFSSEIGIDKFGQYGDFIGGFGGSLWALAGVLLFYKALTEQRVDFANNKKALDAQVQALEQQIVEFDKQRNELVNSRKVYEEQTKTSKIQQFESNFYSFFNIYLKIKDTLLTPGEKDYFKTIFDQLETEYPKNIGTSIIETNSNIIKLYEEIFEQKRGNLSHYFKSFYRLIKMIDNSNLDDDHKKFFSKILRAQLTDYEQLVLYYNSHSSYGIKARPLILKYNLFKHLPTFTKPEFLDYFKKDPKILKFADELYMFLAKHIEKLYDIGNEDTHITEKFTSYKCIVGIYFESFEIKVICSNEIHKDGFILDDVEFKKFLCTYLYEKLIFFTYTDVTSVKIEDYTKTNSNTKEFGIKIVSDKTIYINQDR